MNKQPNSSTGASKSVTLSFALLLIGLTELIFAQQLAVTNVNFPTPKPGYSLFIVTPPSRQFEPSLKLQLSAGKLVDTDDCTNVWINATLDQSQVLIKNQFYPTFTMNIADYGSDLNSCVPAKPVKKEASYNWPSLVEYNSARAIAVYIPTGLSLVYRVVVTESPVIVPAR